MRRSLGLGLLSLLASSVWAGPFSEVPRSHWAYAALARLQAMGLVEAPDFGGPVLRTRYEFALGLQRAWQSLEALAREAETRQGQPLLPAERWVGLTELQAIGQDLERLTQEFSSELQGMGMKPSSPWPLILRLQGNLSALEWREGLLKVRSLALQNLEPQPLSLMLPSRNMALAWLEMPGEAREVLLIPLPLLNGMEGSLRLSPVFLAPARWGWEAEARIPLLSWGEAMIRYRPGVGTEEEALLGARLRLGIKGLDVQLGYTTQEAPGPGESPSSLTAAVQHRWEGLTLRAGYRRVRAGLETEPRALWLGDWSSSEYQAFLGGVAYSDPRWAMRYQFEQYQSSTHLVWGRHLALLEYYAQQGLTLQFRYEGVQSAWARWPQGAWSALAAGLRWEISPQFQVRLLHQLPPTSSFGRRPGFSEGITFSEVAVHF